MSVAKAHTNGAATTTTTTTATTNSATPTTQTTLSAQEQRTQQLQQIQKIKAQLPPIQHNPLKCAVLGNVDAGKSTFVGVITTGIKDSVGHGNRGFKIRELVANHPHEAEIGKTTSASTHLFGYDQEGNHVFFNPLTKQQQQNDTNGNRIITSEELRKVKINKAKAWDHIVTNSTRVVTLLDLAGHQKYLRTSITHLVANMADIALILVSPNTGLSKMAVEHFSLAIALRLRICVLVTKIDKAPIDVLKTLRVDLNNFIQFQAQRTPVTIKGYNELFQVLGGNAATVPIENMVPIFYISNTTLQHFDLLHTYLSRVQQVTWLNRQQNNDDQIVTIDSADDVNVAKHLKDTNNSIVNNFMEQQGNGGNGGNNSGIKHTNGNGDIIDDFHALSVQSHGGSTTMSGSIQPTMSTAIPPTLTFQTTSSTVGISINESTNQQMIIEGQGEARYNSMNPISSNQIMMSSGSTTGIDTINSPLSHQHQNQNQQQDQLTTITTNTCTGGTGSGSSSSSVNGGGNTVSMLQREVGVPHYLPFITGELRVEDRYQKANTGLILSGTVTYGCFENNNLDQFVLLGPFSSKLDLKSNSISSNTVEAIQHALKKNTKMVIETTATAALGHHGKGHNTTNTTATGHTTAAAGKGGNITAGKGGNQGKKEDLVNKNDNNTLDVEFVPVIIKSMQQYRSNVNKASIGEGIGICIKYDEKTHKLMQKNYGYRSKYNHLKDWDRDDIVRGMVLLSIDTSIPVDTSTLPINKLAGIKDLFTSTLSTTAGKNNTSKALVTTNNTTNTANLPAKLTFKKYQVPYPLFLSSSIDIDVEILNPSSCFKQGYQIVMHCSSLVLSIIVESVLCVMDKSGSGNNNSNQKNKNKIKNIIEMADMSKDTRQNPFLNSIIESSTTATAAATTTTATSSSTALTTTAATGVTSTSVVSSPQQHQQSSIPINNDILLRCGQRGLLRCRFLHVGYVYIHENEQIILRDGSVKAIGTVSATFF